MSLLDLLGIQAPILQAPMAGVATPELAAAVSNAGGLGALGVGATTADGARAMIAAFRSLSSRPLHVNVFCHPPARADAEREARWIERLRPEFLALGAEPPARLREIYRSYRVDGAMHAMLLAEKPEVVSFHFGVPRTELVAELRAAGIVLLASATSPAEAHVAAEAGVHAIVAQGYEAGGHRGVFDPEAPDDQLGTFALVRILARELTLPIIAAGGIMDGAGIAAALRLGAEAVQLGTAFVACDESAADAGYRGALRSEAARHTTMTRAISGRPARALPNRMTAWRAEVDVPDYPIAYDLGKALHAAGKARYEEGYGAHWAGQGAPLARAWPAAELVAELRAELAAAH